MLTPILRLVMIYVLLALVVVGVFNRDKLIRLVTGQGGTPVAEAPASMPAPQAETAPAEAAAQDSAPATLNFAPPVAPAPAQPTMPGQSVQLQTPVAPAPNATVQPGIAPAPAPQALPTAPAMPDIDLAQAINAARQAYWTGDPDGARSQLEALTAAHPDNADLFGELGNFHFSSGDYPAAAQAFEQAGTLLARQGRGAQAMALLPVLQRLDPARAEALAGVLGLR